MKVIVQFMKYVFVGGAAFIIDAAVLWILGSRIHYLAATAIAFIAGLIVNYTLSKRFVFTSPEYNKAAEFTVYALIGIAGLGITELLMYIFTDRAGIYYMFSKIMTAAIVLVWNFVARKIILYRR